MGSSLLILALLLRLHAAVVEGVDSGVGATVDASVCCIESLRLGGDGVREVLAAGSAFEVLFRHRNVATGVEGRGAEGTVLRAGLFLLEFTHLHILRLSVRASVRERVIVRLTGR